MDDTFLVNGKPLESLRVLDLKAELESRGLSKSGNKKDLLERLRKFLIQNADPAPNPNPQVLSPRSTSLPSVNIDKELVEENDMIKQYLAQRESMYKEANTSTDEEAAPPAPDAKGQAVSPAAKVKKDQADPPATKADPPATEVTEDANKDAGKEGVKKSVEGDKKDSMKEAIVPKGKEQSGCPPIKPVPEKEPTKLPVAPKEEEQPVKPVPEKGEPTANERLVKEKAKDASSEELKVDEEQEIGISFEVDKEDDVVMQDQQQIEESKKQEQATNEPQGKEKEEVEHPEAIIPIRTIGKPVIQRHKRQWSRNKAKGGGDSLDTVSSATLKDIVPDIKEALQKEQDVVPSLQLQEEKFKAEDEEKVVDKEEEVEGTTKNTEEEEKVVEKDSVGTDIAVKPTIADPIEEAEDDGDSVVQVTNLVRPFTLNQLKELLSRTGEIDGEDGFLINKIKSECWVKYKKSSDAKDTVSALDGVRWPNSNPKKLSVRLSNDDKFAKFKSSLESRDSANSLANRRPQPIEKSRKRPRERDNNSPGRGQRTSEKRRKQEDSPKMLEELFNKTKATPNIYWKMATSS